jgi:hypothetical protein
MLSRSLGDDSASFEGNQFDRAIVAMKKSSGAIENDWN